MGTCVGIDIHVSGVHAINVLVSDGVCGAAGDSKSREEPRL